MAGRKKQQVFVYSEDGKPKKAYNSMSECARDNGFSENAFLMNKHSIIHLKNGGFACLYRIGREGIRQYKQRMENPFVGANKEISRTHLKNNKKGNVVLFNIDGEEIARFLSIFEANKILKDVKLYRMKAGGQRKSIHGYIIKVEKI